MSAVQVGDMGVKVLQKRGKRVRQKAREAKGLIGAPGGDEMENSEESDAEVEDDNSASTPKRLPLDSLLQSELYHSFPNSHRLYDYYEGNSFDPQVLTENDVAWLRQCRTLGFNSVMEKAYITGLGLYTGWGTFETNDGGIDPIDPYCGVVKGYPCYVEDGGDIDDPTYPFHEACYTIFAKYLGSSDPADIEKDVMYKTARKLFGNGRRSLMVDYGVDGGEQFWANQPGEEVRLCNASQCPLLPNCIQTVHRDLSRRRGPRAARNNLEAHTPKLASHSASTRLNSESAPRSIHTPALRPPASHNPVPVCPGRIQPYEGIAPRQRHDPRTHVLEKYDSHTSCAVVLGDPKLSHCRRNFGLGLQRTCG